MDFNKIWNNIEESPVNHCEEFGFRYQCNEKPFGEYCPRNRLPGFTFEEESSWHSGNQTIGDKNGAERQDRDYYMVQGRDDACVEQLE